jgi:hypothetical protein
MPRLTVREIEQRIQAELPLGSPKEVVEAWLKAQPHVKFSRSDAAIFQNTGPRLSLGAPTHIRVIFKFDDEDRLEKYTVTEWNTSL